MICNAFGTTGISPSTEAIVGSAMLRAARKEGHRPALPVGLEGNGRGYAKSEVTIHDVMTEIIESPWITRGDLASKLGCTESVISNRLRTLRLGGVKMQKELRKNAAGKWQWHFLIRKAKA